MKILITGASNGMGKGVAKALHAVGDHAIELILLCRSEVLGKAMIEEMSTANPQVRTSLVVVDFSSMETVKQAEAQIRQKHQSLDAVFFNAGIGYAKDRITTVDGFNEHFQVNFLAQFSLLVRLLDLLENSDRGGRVIFNVTPFGSMHWDDLQMERSWSYETAIQQAMVAKRLALVYLDRLYQEKTPRITFTGFCIHKTVASNQLNIIPPLMRAMVKVMRVFGTFISIEECGNVMAPLFLEPQDQAMARSGTMISWKKDGYYTMAEDTLVLDTEQQNRLISTSLDLLADPELARALATSN